MDILGFDFPQLIFPHSTAPVDNRRHAAAVISHDRCLSSLPDFFCPVTFLPPSFRPKKSISELFTDAQRAGRSPLSRFFASFLAETRKEGPRQGKEERFCLSLIWRLLNYRWGLLRQASELASNDFNLLDYRLEFILAVISRMVFCSSALPDFRVVSTLRIAYRMVE